MRKIIIILLIISVLITGCLQKTKEREDVQETATPEPTPSVEQYVDDNKMPISIYEDGDYILTRVNKYKTRFTLGKDISVFVVYPSTAKQIKYTNRFADGFYKEWNKINTDNTYKMGYHLAYSLEDGTQISHYIFKPQDTMRYKKYIKIYLYDDYTHRNDSWYSHVTNEEYNANTYLTSIKLTPGTEISKVTSNVELMAFTYNGKDDFENGEYRGISKDILLIEQQR
jgi:hypothetical protein